MSNTGYSAGVVEVLYSHSAHTVQVWTYTSSQNWVQRGSDITSVTFANGDVFGARATSAGQVSVYKNESLLGTRDITAWPYYASSGYIGLWFDQAGNALLDDPSTALRTSFGGGTVPGSSLLGVKVKASLVKAAHGEKTFRKAQVLVSPPSGQVWKSYYFQGSVRLAMRVQVNGVGDKVDYLLTDHLNSTAITVDEIGSKQAELRYAPWGTIRYVWGETPTDYRYTGQREDSYINLYWYSSRWYEAEFNLLSNAYFMSW